LSQKHRTALLLDLENFCYSFF